MRASRGYNCKGGKSKRERFTGSNRGADWIMGKGRDVQERGRDGIADRERHSVV